MKTIEEYYLAEIVPWLPSLRDPLVAFDSLPDSLKLKIADMFELTKRQKELEAMIIDLGARVGTLQANMHNILVTGGTHGILNTGGIIKTTGFFDKK